MKRVLVLLGVSLLGVLALVPGCASIASLLNQPPTAYINYIRPSEVTEGDSVRFSGYGTDTDGRIVAYRWLSNRDGQIGTTAEFETTSLSVGLHDIYFLVQDNNDAWSAEVRGSVRVLEFVPPPVVIVSFSASRTSIIRGDSTTLSWNVRDATTVFIDQGIGTVVPAGSVSVTPQSTTTYRLSATGPGSNASAQLTVTVEDPKPEIIFFRANPQSVTSGNSTRLSWQTTGATEVRILPLIGEVAPSGSINVTLTGNQTHTFTLLAQNGPVTDTAEVQIVSQVPMPSLYSTTLLPVLSASGYVRSDGSPLYQTGNIQVGDDDDDFGVQGFLTFDISDIPDDAIINNVFVDLSDYQSIEGDPFDDLGCLRAYVHTYGALNSADYVTGAVSNAIARWCSLDEIDDPGGGLTSGFRDALQSRVGNNTLQIRFQFNNTETDSDGDDDLIRWNGTDLPRLTVQFFSYE